jgi:hypothetical protein
VKELLQFNLAEDIRKELYQILNDAVYRKKMLDDYDEIILKLGKEGTSKRIAEKICELIQ